MGASGDRGFRGSVCDEGEAGDTNDIWATLIGDYHACRLPHTNSPNLSAICV